MLPFADQYLEWKIKGFMKSKGKLIRAILFPKPIHFRFFTDLVKVAALFFILGLGY